MKSKINIPISFQLWLNQDKIKLDQGIPQGLALWDDPTLINDFKCGICTNVAWDVAKCQNCGQCYCQGCIKQKFQKHAVKCLSCDKEILDSSPDLLTIGVLSKLQFNCFFYEEGCKERINYEDYENHLSICLFRRRSCQICGTQYYQKDLQKHKKECWEVEEKCGNCGTQMNRKTKFQHKELECMQIIIKNQGNLIQKLIDRITNLENHQRIQDNDINILDEEIEDQKVLNENTKKNIESIENNIEDNQQKIEFQITNFKDFVIEITNNLQGQSEKQKKFYKQLEDVVNEVNDIKTKVITKEKPFEFTEHSRLIMVKEEQGVSISLREEKRDVKGNKQGAVFEIFQSSESSMFFDDIKCYIINFEVIQLRGQIDIGLLVNDQTEISISSKGKLKKRINNKQQKIWKLQEQREISFSFQQGDRIEVQITGWKFIIYNLTREKKFETDIRNEIERDYLQNEKTFNFSGGLYEEGDQLIFYK